MTSLLDTARSRWDDWGCALPLPESLVLLALKKESSKATTAFLLDRSGKPVAVAKAARTRAGATVLAMEAEAARRWQAAQWPVARQSCPHVLDLDDGILWMTAVPGRTMLSQYLSAWHLRRRSSVIADFAAAGRWIDSLHEQSRGSVVDLASLTAEQGLVFRRFTDKVSDDPEIQELFELAQAALSVSCPDGVVGTAVHGDFWMGNLLVEAGSVTGVVDLELSMTHGLPLRDVLKLPLSYALYLDSAGRHCPRPGTWSHLVGFEQVFLGRGPLAGTAEAFVLGRLHRLGVSPLALRAFFPQILAEQALLQMKDPASAHGYAQVLRALARHRSSSWTWRSLA
jgi:aminoglycoside phosphotransferase